MYIFSLVILVHCVVRVIPKRHCNTFSTGEIVYDIHYTNSTVNG